MDGGVFSSTGYNTRIFIMTPADYAHDIEKRTFKPDGTVEDPGTSALDISRSVRNSEPEALFDGHEPLVSNRLGQIRAALLTLMPGITPVQFNYRRHTYSIQNAFGKAVVSVHFTLQQCSSHAFFADGRTWCLRKFTGPVQQQSGS